MSHTEWAIIIVLTVVITLGLRDIAKALRGK